MAPYRIYGRDAEGDIIYFTGELSDLIPVYGWVRDHRFLYERLQSVAQVAILYSFPTDFARESDYRNGFRGLTYALLDDHLQYDIVALGDDLWLKDTFTSESLASYQMVFLPGIAYLSDDQVGSIWSFVEEGGTAVAWGELGTHDELGQQVERPELAPLREPGTHAHGDGWFITLAGDPGETYRQTHDPTVRQQLAALVHDHGESMTATSAPRTLNVLAYQQAAGSRFVAHLLNYDYDIATDQVQPTDPFTMTLNPPAGFLDQTEVQLYQLSPLRQSAALLNFEVKEISMFVEHPGLWVYNALLAMPKADALALAEDTLELLWGTLDRAEQRGIDTRSLDGLVAQIDAATTVGNHLHARQLGLQALEQLGRLARPRILFDEAHNEKNTISWERAQELNPEHPEWVYFGALVTVLEDEFVFERNATEPLSPQLLEDYDALMLAAPKQKVTQEEKQAITQFVAAGGGLIMLGDCALDESLNRLSTAYGITYDLHCIFAPIPEANRDFVVHVDQAHPAITIAPFLTVNRGNSLAAEGSALVLARTGTDAWQDLDWDQQFDPGERTGPYPMLAVAEDGQGRVVAVADNTFPDHGFAWRSNSLPMRSLLRWVTHWTLLYGPYQIYVPLAEQ